MSLKDIKPFFKTSLKVFIKSARRLFWTGVASFMIGVSTVILEEERSINDTGAKIEQHAVESDEE